MIDADMERFIKMNKEHFVGKEATLRQKREERALQLIYFEVESTEVDVRGSEPIFIGDNCIGVTTSGGYGHFVKRSLGFGYVPPAMSEPGTELSIDLLGERCRTTVLKDPAYDPANTRLQA